MVVSRLARSSVRTRVRNRRRTDLRSVPLGQLRPDNSVPCPELEVLARFVDPPGTPPPPVKPAPLDEVPVTMKKMNSALSALTVLEFEVVTALFPANGCPAAHEEIASRFGLSLIEVKEIEANALRNLRGTKFGTKRSGAPWN